MARDVQIQYRKYTVMRHARSEASEGAQSDDPIYRVLRADGSELCCGVSWPDVERLIDEDERGASKKA